MEKIADIVAEMRKRFEPYAKSNSNDARYVAYLGYAEFADRIERAYKNESFESYIRGVREGVQDFATKMRRNITKCIGEYGIPKEDK